MIIKYNDLIIISIITILLGILSEYYIRSNEKYDNILTQLKNNNLKYIFFISLFGIMIHLCLSYFKFEEWYCKKICIEDTCQLVCYKSQIINNI